MKAAVTEGKGDIRIVEVPMPEIGPYRCLCKIDACATCSGTDWKIVRHQLPWHQDYPGIVGHESVGRIVKTGSKVRHLKEGDVTFRPTAAYPGEKLGDFHSLWGGFAEYGLVTDTRALMEENPRAELGYAVFQMQIPAGLRIEPADAAMIITLKETAGFVVNMKVTLNSSVVVMGTGPVAMAMVFFARLLGAWPLIVVGRRGEPLTLMKRLGADMVVNNATEDTAKKVREITGGKGVDFVLDTTGDARLVGESFSLLNETGKMGPYAVYKSDDAMKSFDQTKIAQAATGEVPTHEYLMDLVRMGLVPLKEFYSHRMPFTEIEKGFGMLDRKEAFKVVFDM